MLMHKLGQKVGRALAGVIERGELNTGDVILKWLEEQPSEGPFDRNVEASYPETIERTQTVSALVHFVNQSMVLQQFAEYQTGDAIVTFDAGFDLVLDLSTLKGLTFTLPDGQVYVPGKMGDEVARYYDLVIGNQRMSRTVALKLK